jgi:hypothetical protein
VISQQPNRWPMLRRSGPTLTTSASASRISFSVIVPRPFAQTLGAFLACRAAVDLWRSTTHPNEQIFCRRAGVGSVNVATSQSGPLPGLWSILPHRAGPPYGHRHNGTGPEPRCVGWPVWDAASSAALGWLRPSWGHYGGILLTVAPVRSPPGCGHARLCRHGHRHGWPSHAIPARAKRRVP